MQTHPKPSDTLQAQVAAFTAENVADYRDATHVFDNLGSIAIGDVVDVSRQLPAPEYYVADGDFVKFPAGAERTVATSPEYVEFLRSVKGSGYEGIKLRTEMMRAYEGFAPAVARLKEELADPATRKEHPDFLGAGSNAMAFSLQHGDKWYAVRVPSVSAIKPAAIDSHVAGAILGKDIPHLEQIVAVSYEDGVTVAEMMPGKEMSNLTVSEIQKVTDGQLTELANTLIAAHEQGIQIDPKPSNWFYDVQQGYGLVDYGSSKTLSNGSKPQSLGEVVGCMSIAIGKAGNYGKLPKRNPSAEDYAHKASLAKVNYDVLGRFRAMVEHKLKGTDQAKALQQIDERLQSMKDAATNPNYVTEQLALDQESKHTREEAKRRVLSNESDIM